MELMIIIGLVLVNGVFAMAEIAFVSARRFKLESAKRKGHVGAESAIALTDNPNKFLSTIQIGITLIGILLGVYSGKHITEDVEQVIRMVSWLRPWSPTLAVGLVVLFVTYLSIVLGELLPKRIGMSFPEPIAMYLSRPMLVLSAITSPFVWLLTVSNNFLLGILGIKKTLVNSVSEEEIKSIIRESAAGGEIQDIEQSIVERVFELGDRKVDSLFTHRRDMVFFDINDSWEMIRAKVDKEKHSAYPVCEGHNIDEIVGIVLLKDLFTPIIEKDFDIRNHIKMPLFINENTFAYRVLELFQKEKMHYAIVVDEYGVTQGMVTMDDVMEALVGYSAEMDLDECKITQRDEQSWFVDGQYSAQEFLKFFSLSFDEFSDGHFTTVAGMVIHKNNSLPNIGDRFTFGQYEVEVIDKDGQRIDKLMVRKK